MIDNCYIVSNGPQHSGVCIRMTDGRTIFVNIGPKVIDVGIQPDDCHYPNFFARGTIPTTGFDPY